MGLRAAFRAEEMNNADARDCIIVGVGSLMLYHAFCFRTLTLYTAANTYLALHLEDNV